MNFNKISININEDDDNFDKDIDENIINDLKNEIDKIVNKNNIINDDKPIIEVSPNGTYLVTYDPKDHSIVGWNAKEIEEGQLTKSDAPVKVNKVNDSKDQITEISDSKDQITEISDSKIQITEISVSDDKKLAYTVYKDKDNLYYLNIIDINHSDQTIKLTLISMESARPRYYAFNSKNEFILYVYWIEYDKFHYKECKGILIYSTETKNHKWNCKRYYEIPESFKLINISKYDKLYLLSNNSIYEWGFDTEKGMKIFYNKDLESYYRLKKRELKNDVRISSNEKFICLRIMDKINIYPIDLAIPVVSLDINNDTSLYKSMKYSDLLLSLLPLQCSETQNYIMGYCWKECLNRLGLKDENLKILSCNIQTTDKYAFGILNGNVWKIKLEENIPKINFSSQDSDVQIIEDSNDHFDEHLYLNKISELFQRVSNSSKYKGELNHNQELDKSLAINLYMNKKRKLFEIVSKIEKKSKQYNGRNLIERTIITETTDKLLLAWKIKIIDHNKIMLQVFKKANVSSKLELTEPKTTEFNVNAFRKIKLLEIELSDDDIILITTIGFLIYHFNENEKSISLIYWNYLELTIPNISTLYADSEDFKDLQALRPDLPSLNWDSFKICDEWISYVKDNKKNLLEYGVRLLSFAIKEHKLDLIEEIYKKCIDWFEEDLGKNKMVLNKYHFISNNGNMSMFAIFYFILLNNLTNLTTTKTPMITFMVPYINFINYPQNYSWFSELIKPQPSPFIETMNRDIYNTWSGEAIINFKWNTYGKFYYSIIWIGFMTFLGCFTAAATIPLRYIDDDIRKKLLVASIVFGFIHLSFEIRQIIFDVKKWIRDFWNIFGIIF
ncbi:hypothetical protein GLOIN_2v1826879 [Rhizophagus irregularis DAOM 181602=DAOM 197198]|uniref:Uncharacterized protein n=1 Tax=Rhizophagus irregularis (strain DAOM 181602 / DAOM 197198 / MUCL 43194) TaxID=747089 RepID=A0A2P4Q7W7_RHIID|nr:hypothetical protein GLOIN_2v1826879 [Rhizophagus irregularis DAOM 181602=DAOM 197198]POG73726.1 hypothetical protein GLOIN_2v1826879 [Rhizophagus irregularis DAOM 181602=DAOM 197198]|eukprot:XP_025180592.1 hypothetical protein GLOIN_2v1826879 [Rhizophagus irregularis DAOM 181602=DAOM 197198]